MANQKHLTALDRITIENGLKNNDSFKAIAKKLDIGEGDPILVRERYVYDVHDVPVEYNIGYYRADNFTYSIEFTKE